MPRLMSVTRETRRRAGLTRERVVEAALRLIDAEGEEALTMRRLGSELGVEAMSLYEYTAGKDKLLLAVAERLVDEFELPLTGRGEWRERIRGVVGASARSRPDDTRTRSHCCTDHGRSSSATCSSRRRSTLRYGTTASTSRRPSARTARSRCT